jgi:RNA polymerase sigma-B factor
VAERGGEGRTLELIRAYQEHGDLKARDLLIAEHMPLVRSLARRYSGRGEPLEDLVQVAAIGLIKAVERFEPERGLGLPAYAVPTIVGELKRHFRDAGWAVHVPRRLKELSARLNRLVDELGSELGRSPTIAELAGSLGADEEEVIEALDAARAYSAVPLASPQHDPGEAETPLDPLASDEEGFSTGEDRAVLAPGLAALGERERRILHLRFFAGLSQSEIAAQIGISQMHVSRLIRRSLETMRATLDESAGEERG